MNKDLLILPEQLRALRIARELRIKEACSNPNSDDFTLNPTITPSIQSSINIGFPSCNPTLIPTVKHTIANPVPTSEHGFITLKPSSIPSLSSISKSSIPTVLPAVCSTENSQEILSYDQIECNSNSSVLIGTTKNDEFNLSCNGKKVIYDKGGNNKYNLFVVSNSSFICENFEPECDLIDLSAFNEIHHFTDLVIYGGPATIHLPNEQKLILNGLLPSALREENFIFNLNSDAPPEVGNDQKPLFYEQSWFIAVSSVAGFALIVCIGVIVIKCVGCLNPPEFTIIQITPDNINPAELSTEKIIEIHPDDIIKAPIGLALSVKNIELIKYENSTVKFDYHNNGAPLKTSWVGSDDAILVYDHNDNRQVDFAKEIVLTEWCVEAKTDFEALLCNFDSNKDKVFNKEDQEFFKFYLWQDKNQDGVSQYDEIASLEEAGIFSIDFNTQEEIQDELRELGALNKAEVLWADGRVTYAYDLVFSHDFV